MGNPILEIETEFKSSFKSLEVGDRLRLREGCFVTTEVGREIFLPHGKELRVTDDSLKFCYNSNNKTDDNNIYIGIRVSQDKDETLVSFVVPMNKCEVIKQRV
ncbi:MAG: hypothetical protein PHZ25_00410 [Candidatus Pacebacteria bacterium]|nr:hypothetical protein [Candidatus Paceibacterota bacterium]